MIDVQSALKGARVIAVVGCSTEPWRTSHSIAKYLQEVGYRIIPVNPNYETVLGETCYPELSSVPGDVTIDIINIFRNRRYTAEMVAMAIQYAEQTRTKPTIWTQINVSSPEAEKLAEQADMPYVRNRCIMVAHRQLH